MLNFFHSLSLSPLKIFLTNGYSLELLFIIVENQSVNKKKGMDEIFFSIVSNKPKRTTFDKFINRLIESNILYKTTLLDKRKVTLSLSKENYEEFISLTH